MTATYATGRERDPVESARRRSLAVRYAIDVIFSALILLWAYRVTGAPGVVWAIITAILVLQPGLTKSVRASAVRIIATLLGAIVGMIAGLVLGGTEWALLAGILVTIALCYCGRLDVHVRQACLTVPIVQMFHDGSIVHVSYERITAILAGCLIPLVVQYASEQFRQLRV